jgi:hypothetical protein
MLETLAKIRKINWLIKIGLVYGVEQWLVPKVMGADVVVTVW